MSGPEGAKEEPQEPPRPHPAITGFAYVAPTLRAIGRLLGDLDSMRGSEREPMKDDESHRRDPASPARPSSAPPTSSMSPSAPSPPAGPPPFPRTPPGPPEPLRLDQIGGLDAVVRQLREIADSFNHPHVMARWGARRPQGVLMFGPPGTGKTTLAKALALEIGGTLREIRTPDILSKWVGASERNIKRVFTEARRYRTPTVLLFDEFDTIVSYTGTPQSAADQVGNSVAGIFKQEMNSLVDENPLVIVVATTNFPERVDDSLIRSGRFDVKLAVPRPDPRGRSDILAVMISDLVRLHEREGFRLFGDDIDVGELGELSAGLTGADLRELLRRAQMTKAMQEVRDGTATAITQADLRAGITQLRRTGQ